MNIEMIRLTGELPRKAEEGLAILREDLGCEMGAAGTEIRCRRGEELRVCCDGTAVELTWQTPVQFYRGLSLIPRPLAPCDIREKARFDAVGPMFDCSRNAVLKPESIRFFLRKMALMGLNLGMMYTEDTYEVPERPYFGYKRGRYSIREMKELDDYADILGIELCPCIQTLGHLRQVLRWPGMPTFKDNEEVLMADDPETYVLLEQMIRAATAPYRSRRIHLGMDEAFGVGLGNHLKKYGYEDPHAIIGRHLSRVLEITEKLGLDAMMWSDMYFSLEGGSYYAPGDPSESARKAVDPRVTLVYWDYYHDDRAIYDDMFRKHKLFSAPTAFAGGLWNWISPAIDYPVAIANSVPAIEACIAAGTKTVLVTMWGDDGAECSLLAALLGLQLYAEMSYTGIYDEKALAERFRRCCHGDARAFLDISLLNVVPGIRSTVQFPSCLVRMMLYQDPLVQLFEDDTKDLQMSDYYGDLVGKYAGYAAENPEYRLLFDFYAALAHTLSLKTRWHEQAGRTVRSGDREGAAVLASDLAAAMDSVEALRGCWRSLWETVNKPQGFEIIDGRLGAVRARLSTAAEKMTAFAEGRAEDIPELSEACLPYRRNPDNTFGWTNTMTEIVSPSKLDFVI